MIFNLTNDDLQRLSKSGINEIIENNNRLIKNCVSKLDIQKIEKENKELEKLLAIAK